jgi:hypothetical protein
MSLTVLGLISTGLKKCVFILFPQDLHVSGSGYCFNVFSKYGNSAFGVFAYQKPPSTQNSAVGKGFYHFVRSFCFHAITIIDKRSCRF